MNRRQIALKLVLNELGMDQSMTSFDDRLVIQKAIYLLQQMGIHLGYPYSWYLRGPYSRDLTADAFANVAAELPEGWVLDGEQKEKLARAKQFLSKVTAGSSKPRELEKLASVLFLIKTHQAPADNSDSITARMTAAGKDFSRGEVDDAVRVLREHRLISV